MADVDTTDAPIVPASGSQHKAEQAGAFLPPDGQTPESIAHAWSLQAQNAAETTDHPGGLDVDMDVDLGPEMRKMDTATCVAETEWSQFPSMSAAVQSEVDPQSEGPSDAGSVCSGASSCSSANHFRGNKRRPAKRLLVTHTMGLQPSSALQLIIESGDDIHTHYDLDRKLLGEGSFGVVRKGTLKATGAVRAVKAISKKKMKTMNAIIKLEIQIMKQLDHPNLLMLYEVLEDAKNLYLVLEMCTGGSLQDHITRSGSLPEKTTAGLIQQILRAVVYLHKHQIVHRDMKAENCLIDKAGPLDDATLKVADFGLSCKIEPGKALVKIVGTPTHMAPEVIAKKYTQICDVWSCGVILYVMLSGHLPFRGSTREEIQKNITQGAVEFKDKEWLDVSQAAVDFVLSLLKKHPKKRFTAVQALSFAWIKDCVPPAAKAKLQWRVIEDLRKFRRRNRFKRAALHVMASMLTEDDVKENRKAFIALDRDGDGFFTIEELAESLKADVFACPETAGMEDSTVAGTFGGAQEIDNINGFTYTEFLAATFDMQKAVQEGLCRAAFASFDKNHDGSISISELASGKMLGSMAMDEVIETMEALDADGNCELDYAEFMKMMRGSTWDIELG